MNDNIFIVWTENNPFFGKIVHAMKYHRDSNLVSFVKNHSDITHLRICQTWKEAKELSDTWNEIYRITGRQHWDL